MPRPFASACPTQKLHPITIRAPSAVARRTGINMSLVGYFLVLSNALLTVPLTKC